MLDSFQTQGYAVATTVDLDDSDADVLMELHHVCRMGNATIGHLGDMDEAVLMDADVDEGSEVGNIGHDAWQDHAFHQIIDGGNILVELEFLDLFARVAAWLLQFLENIREGRDAHLGRHIFPDVDGLALFLIINKVCDRAVVILCHLLDDGVALRMDGRIVERVACSRNTEETCALLIGSRAKTRYLLQLGTGAEGTILFSIVHDVLGKGGPKTADIHQQMLGGCVEVDADKIDATLHSLIQ